MGDAAYAADRQRLFQGNVMGNYSRKHKLTEANQEEALRIARGTQRPGQTKEQTRLIAQGIQRGIEQYKKQQSAKDRELDKRRRKTSQQTAPAESHTVQVQERLVYRQHWLPWALLVISWSAMALYWFLR